MNQGLHHLPQERISAFLAQVKRVLRPSGLFIVREHDASPDLIPMLDLAHSVFNAVTGVPLREEMNEIRAFRPVQQWRQIIRSAGFVDSMLYEMEKGDPTFDEMLCFVKPPFDSAIAPQMSALDEEADIAAPPTSVLPAAVDMFLDQLPAGLMDFIKSTLATLEESMPALEATLARLVESCLSGAQRAYAEQMLPQFFRPCVDLLARFATQFEHVDLKEGAISGQLPLEEVILVANGLLCKAAAGKATAMELALVSAIKEAQALLGIASEEKDEAGASISEDAEEFHDCSQEPGRVKKLKRKWSGTDPTPAEVEQLLQSLAEAYPLFTQDPNVLEHAGFPPRAVTVINARLKGSDRFTVANSLAEYLDRRAFEELSDAVQVLVSEDGHEEFSFRNLNRRSSPWWQAAMAVLGSAKIHFTSSGKTMAYLAGLGPIIEMWEAAHTMRIQQNAKERERRGRHSISVQAELSRHESNQITTALKALATNTQHASILLVEKTSRTVKDVALLVRARIVMEEGEVQQELDCSDFMRSVLHNGEICIDDRVMEHLQTNLGLPAPARGYRYKPGDILRGEYKFGGITRGLFGGIKDAVHGKTPEATYTLLLWYETADATIDTYALLPRVQTLIERLETSGQIRELHSDDGEYTWYKLSEWMQVEILEVFASSMSFEPWFRFPFMKFLAMYWKVLFNEGAIVSEKFGARKAFFSMAFLTDMIPGVAMAFFFAQMQLLALPLKAYMGSETYDPDNIVEQLVIQTGFDEPDWESIDPRIREVIVIIPRLYTVIIPTFKVMTQVLLNLAKVANLSVLQISNQLQVQVRAEVHDEAQLHSLKSKMPGCKVMFEYEFPWGPTAKKAPISVSLCVDVPCLLEVIRSCQSVGVDIKQIYDFWN